MDKHRQIVEENKTFETLSMYSIYIRKMKDYGVMLIYITPIRKKPQLISDKIIIIYYNGH